MTQAATAIETETPAPASTRKRARTESIEPLNSSNNSLRIVHADFGVEIDDVRYEGFWQKFVESERVRAFDRFEVRAHDATWRLELTVIRSSPRGIEFHVDRLCHFKPQVATPDDSDGAYTIRFVGGQLPYSIRRDEDGHEMPGRHATLDSARIARARLHPRAQT